MYIRNVICDRCGQQQEVTTKNDIIISFARIELWGVGQQRSRPPQRLDLCEVCYQKFVNYMESEVQGNDTK